MCVYAEGILSKLLLDREISVVSFTQRVSIWLTALVASILRRWDFSPGGRVTGTCNTLGYVSCIANTQRAA